MNNKPANKFNVSDGFFNQLEQNILAETVHENSAKIVPFYQKKEFKTALAVAASLLLLVMILFGINNNQKPTIQDKEVAQEVIFDTYFEDDSQEFTLEEEPVYAEFVINE